MESHCDGWETAMLRYEDGDTFKLMGKSFLYDKRTASYYSEDMQPIYPNEIIITLDPDVYWGGTNLVIAGGGNETQNEIWCPINVSKVSVRFDNLVVRSIGGGENISELRLVEEDKSVWLNGVRRGTYLGTMKFNMFNAREGSSHPKYIKVLKVKVR